MFYRQEFSLVYEWDNPTWQFASKKNYELFKSAQQYAPQYGGYCEYGLSNEWKKDLERRIEKADKSWPLIRGKE